MIRNLVAAACAIALSGCVADRVTLLDKEPGDEVGAIAVISPDGAETVLDQPNTQALLRGATPRVRPVDQLSPAYATLLETLPPPATRLMIRFPVGGSNVVGGQRAILDQIRAEIERRPGAQVEVAGFTDSTGSAKGNDELSLRRAQTVAAELREFDIAIDPEDAVGRGEDEARAALGDNVADSSYRRVYVIIR